MQRLINLGPPHRDAFFVRHVAFCRDASMHIGVDAS